MFSTLSPANRVFITIFVVGGVWAAWHRQWTLVGAVAVGLTFAALSIRAASRGVTSDTTRLDTAQPADERDRLLLDRALAVVGLAAIALQAIEFLYWAGGPNAATRSAEPGWRLVLLCAIWIVANRLVVRRSALGA